MFVFVSSVSEGSDCIDVERVFSHADDVRSGFSQFYMSLFVDALRVGLHFGFYGFLELLTLCFEFCTNFLANLKVLTFIQGKNCSSPLPFKLSFAFVLRLVEEASRTNLIVDYRNWLQSVCEDDVWIHGCNIDVVN